MSKLTALTKKNITDIICYGFTEHETVIETDPFDPHEPGYPVEITAEYKMQYFGKIDEIGFLSRLYDLTSLPSTDNRYRNAEGDIRQHTFYNADWSTGWVFSDSRFRLNGGNDEPFLKFICEMFNPCVRDDAEPWVEFLRKINTLLRNDGYELYETPHVSGRSMYCWRSVAEQSISLPSNRKSNIAPLKMIGEGSYALVYKFLDGFYDRYFVLKRARKDLTAKEIERFKREFEQMKSLHSPYIVEVYNYDDETNEYIMELMDSTLDQYIAENNGKLSFNERKNICNQILRAFAHIHSKDILHRDICPKNILIKVYDDVKVVKVADFGLVKLPDSKLTTISGDYKGYFNDPTLRLDGFNAYLVQHETYAITRVLFFVMTGRTNTDKISNASLKEFVHKGLDADKTKRYQDVNEMVLAFSKIVDDFRW